MATVVVEEVAILYEAPSQSSSDQIDLVKLAKFLKRLSKKVSCTLFTTHEFCNDEKNTVATSKKWNKVAVFVKDAYMLKETVEGVQKRLDAETAVEMRIVVTAPANTNLDVPRCDVIRCESFEEVSDWYPQILVFLFERQQRWDRLAVFMIDSKTDVEMEWYEKIKEICAKFNKTCVWTGNLPPQVSNQNVDTVVVVSRGKGYEVLLRHNNNAHMLKLASDYNINFLVFTNNKRGEAVRAAKEYRDKFESPDPTIIKCKSDLELDYKTWTLLLQEMSIVDCDGVTDDWKTLKIVAIVVLVILLIPVVLFMSAVCLLGLLLYPKTARNLVDFEY